MKPFIVQLEGEVAMPKRVFGRDTRYQGAVVRDDRILLIKHREHKSGRSYWILPGGGIEANETEEECVRREINEETNLDVRIICLLLNEPEPTQSTYLWRKTYLCVSDRGEASPGIEPEPEPASHYSIAEVKWFDLRDETTWDPELVADPITCGQLRRIQQQLGNLPQTR
jgi:8-oxo-dGTP diphosphatase